MLVYELKWKKGKVMPSKDSIISSLKLSKVLMLCVYVKKLSDIILFFTMKYLYQNQQWNKLSDVFSFAWQWKMWLKSVRYLDIYFRMPNARTWNWGCLGYLATLCAPKIQVTNLESSPLTVEKNWPLQAQQYKKNPPTCWNQAWPGCSPFHLPCSSLWPQNLCGCFAYEWDDKRILERADEYVQLWSGCFVIMCRWERGRCRVWICVCLEVFADEGYICVKGRIWGFFLWNLKQ